MPSVQCRCSPFRGEGMDLAVRMLGVSLLGLRMLAVRCRCPPFGAGRWMLAVGTHGSCVRPDLNGITPSSADSSASAVATGNNPGSSPYCGRTGRASLRYTEQSAPIRSNPFIVISTISVGTHGSCVRDRVLSGRVSQGSRSCMGTKKGRGP